VPDDPGAHQARRTSRAGRPRLFVVGLTASIVAAGLAAWLVTTRSSASESRPGTNPAPTVMAAGGASGAPGITAPDRSGRSYVSRIQASGSFLLIPAIHVRAPLVPTGAVGAPETASLTIPADIHTVGWWDGTVQDGDRTVQENAPAPGQPGVALVAGHVDSAAAGPGALHDLGTLKVGDIIEIADSAGQVSTWSVDAAPQTNLKSQLPPALWVTTGAPTLAVVTCGGPFNTTTGHYEDNVIVWARQIS
jgi:Sortase domain